MAVAKDRADGRGAEDFRTVCKFTKNWMKYIQQYKEYGDAADTIFFICCNAVFQAGAISRAVGSSYVEIGSTKVMVGVYGPHEADQRTEYTEEGQLTCTVRVCTFATPFRGKMGQGASGLMLSRRPIRIPPRSSAAVLAPQSAAEKELAVHIKTALASAIRFETFPKAFLDVHCLVLESGGSDLAALVCGASLAVADAGVALSGLVAACAVSLTGGQTLLDPSLTETANAEAGLTLALLPRSEEVVGLVGSGAWGQMASLQEALELAMGGCAQLEELMRETLLLDATKKLALDDQSSVKA